MNFSEESHDAQRTGDGQAADEARKGCRDHAAEHEEQHDTDQWNGGHLGALLVLADGAGELTGKRLQAGELDVAVVDLP